MEKIHLIGWALLLMLFVASAMSITVTNLDDARQKFGTSTKLEQAEEGCEITDVVKVAFSMDEIDSKNYIAKYSLWFYLDGKKTNDTGQVEVASLSKTTIQEAVKPACDATWLELKEKYGTIDMVVIKPDVSSTIVEVYDYVKKTWGIKPTPIIEEEE